MLEKEKMHCDDKRTIFALKEGLNEAIKEKEGLMMKLEREKNTPKRKEIEDKLNQTNEYINELKAQLSHI